ncbi:MAG: 3-oxoacyl-[acyl-carrier-protein] reductase [Dehalococcoidales bacterium]|nr:3-oxoacyl-[acyl-carrier-protein] reductase [Dehalococcoidales bacterium]
MNLTDRVAIVTGSGRGIGKAIALKLAAAGANVVINDVGDPQTAEGVAAEIKALGRQSLAVIADVSAPAEVTAMIDKTIAAFGKIDILVNNAGITRDQLLLRMSDDDWDRVLTIDLKSVFLCTRAVLRPMLKARWGRIVSLSSVVGIVGNAGQANYSSAKAGIIGFTRSVAKEVASRGITANAIAPGFIDTEMTRKLTEEQRQAAAKQIPVGYLGSPDDVAAAIVFLASEEARYITGQVLNVDGGLAGAWM